jgi:hypothetical protein
VVRGSGFFPGPGGGGGGGTEILRSRAPIGRGAGGAGAGVVRGARGSWVEPVSGSTSTSAVGSRDDFGGSRSAMGPYFIAIWRSSNRIR